MTRLLVSVRDVEEARIALEAGVDLIDLKEPSRGALGAVDFKTATEIARLRDASPGDQRHVPLSMALGELSDYFPDGGLPAQDANTDPAAIPQIPTGIRYVKVGLAGCDPREHWKMQLRWFVRNVVRARAFVAVVYADGDAVSAPTVDEILAEAIKLNARAVLVDTAIKDGRTLLDHWTPAQLAEFVGEVERHSMLSVVGGGLNLGSIPTAAASYPSYVAVRGAACRAGRTSNIDADCIRAIRDVLPQPTLRT